MEPSVETEPPSWETVSEDSSEDSEAEDSDTEDSDAEDSDAATSEWLSQIISTEINPLLEEYWFDQPEKVEEAFALLRGTK